MIATLEQVNLGVEKYIEREIAFKSTGLQKFMIYFALPSIPNKIQELIKKYHDFIIPYFDENGNVRLDDLYSAMKQAMQKTIQFEWNGIIFKENDIDMLYSIIKEQ